VAVQFSDKDINRLITEKKPLPDNYRNLIQVKTKQGHRERELNIKGKEENDFWLILRQSISNPIDFSVILAYRPQNSNQLFRLLRCNGKHEHTNTIEKVTFDDFHIHTATERYQEIGAREDGFAEPTNRFFNFQEAIEYMLKNGNFEVPSDPQGLLFEEI
jgi:hypothetical protein